MISHISIAVIDYHKSLEFYDQTLADPSYKRVMTFDNL